MISLAVDKSFTYAAGGGIGASPLICIWDISSGEIIAKISGLHKRSINALAFSPDGRYIVSVGGDNNHRIAVYECHSGRLVASTEGDTNRILCCAWGEQSACGGFHIATGGMKHMKLWTLSGSSLSFKQALWGASGRPTVVALEYLSPSSNAAPSQLLAATAGGDVFRFSSPSSKAKHSKGHAGSVYALSASPVSSDGTQLVASGGRDGKLCIWKANGELVGSVQACASPGLFVALAVSPLHTEPSLVSRVCWRSCWRVRRSVHATSGWHVQCRCWHSSRRSEDVCKRDREQRVGW